MKNIIDRFNKFILALIIALTFTFSILLFLDYNNMIYFQTINRVTFKSSFDVDVDLNLPLIMLILINILLLLFKRKFIIVVFTLLLMIPIYFFLGVSSSLCLMGFILSLESIFVFKVFEEFVILISLFWFMLEFSSLIYWAIIEPFKIPYPLTQIVKLDYDIYSVMALFSCPIFLILAFHWIINPLIGSFLKDLIRILGLMLNLGEKPFYKEFKLHYKLIFVLAIILAVVTALYPHIPLINPYGYSIATDMRHYINEARRLQSNLWYAFKGYISGSRPLMLLLIYGLSKFSGLSLEIIVKFMPLIIHPLLTITVYFMVKKATGDGELASLSSLLTVLGIIPTSNMYAYILANTLAIAILYASIGFLLNSMKNVNLKEAIISALIGVVALLVHPWTFLQYYAAISLMALIVMFKPLIKQRKLYLKPLIPPLIFLLITGIVSIVKSKFFGGVEMAYLINEVMNWFKLKTPVISHLINFWRESIMAFSIYYGGSISNTIIMLLALLGVYTIKDVEMKDFMTSITMVSIAAYTIVYDHSKVRILLNIPLGVMAAYGLIRIIKSRSISKRMKTIVFTTTITSMITYTMRFLANIC